MMQWARDFLVEVGVVANSRPCLVSRVYSVRLLVTPLLLHGSCIQFFHSSPCHPLIASPRNAAMRGKKPGSRYAT